MQTMSRRVNEGLVINGQIKVTVVEIGQHEVTFELTGPDGQIEEVTIPCLQSNEQIVLPTDAELIST